MIGADMFHTQNGYSKLSQSSSSAPQRIPSLPDNRIHRVALIGTFAPRKCGIATFTGDLKSKVETFHPNIEFTVFALDRLDAVSLYPRDVRLIAAEGRQAYRDAAECINVSGVDAVWLQHEYGIFGGADGEFVCDLVDRLRVPLIVTFHTILSEPSDHQRLVLRRILNKTAQAMVMSRHGRDLLIDSYGAARESVTIIEHGAPDRPYGREIQFKTKLGVAGRPVLMTFGLLGPGKGIEHAIEALPAIAARHPDIVYRIVGATHPNLLREHGEEYRERLKARVAQLGVESNVVWDDRFLDTNELLDQIEACDIYLTPYPNLQQSTSGTLSYAVALGKAVVSTPYIHARELLADNVGVLVPTANSSAIAKAVTTLLDDPHLLASIKGRAHARGRSTIWPSFAQASADLITKAASVQRLPVLANADRRTLEPDRDFRPDGNGMEPPCPAHRISYGAQAA